MAQGRPSPFRGLHDLFTEMERMRELGRRGSGAGGGGPDTEAGWVPAVDIFAADDDLVIRLDVPGVTPDDISITFGDGMLTISASAAAACPTGRSSTPGNAATVPSSGA